jgi:putative membrane protein insertion efficiency factor
MPGHALEKTGDTMQKIIISLIRAYQYLLSPFFGAHCRYYPTCSSYAVEAVRQHGVIKGLSLAARRIGRCHPWHEGGYDPVPHNTNKEHH